MDLENFPTSAAAKRMLSYVSTGFYDESYVGKWIYQVMGAKMDFLEDMVETLPYQAFVSTATWGLQYWEILVGLPVREDLPDGERRERILTRLDNRHAVNPAWLSWFCSSITGRTVTVTENQGTYTFSVRIESGEGNNNLETMIRRLDAVKPAHLSYDVTMVVSAEVPIKVGSAIKASNDISSIDPWVDDPLIEIGYIPIYKIRIRPSPEDIFDTFELPSGRTYFTDYNGAHLFTDDEGNLLYEED